MRNDRVRGVETPAQHARREAERLQFDRVAELYEATRSGYPDAVVASMLQTAGTEPGDAVLEVGCGTGQLTRDLARHGLALTAIDIAPAMVATAQRLHGDLDVTWKVTSFEALDAPDDTFALVVSATAFHWVDPAIGWAKAARILRPGGWLAVLGTAEHYDEPFGSALRDLWVRHSDDGGAWASTANPDLVEIIEATGRYQPATTTTHQQRRRLDRATILGLEHTRATSLSYDPETAASFRSGLEALLADAADMPLTQHTTLTLAQAR